MKTKFVKAFAAVMMAFSFAGFARAEGELEITASIAGAGENVTLGEKQNNAYTTSDVVLGADTKLTLTCAGADIYYTTDGSVPTKPTAPEAKDAAATLYADPFVVTEAMKNEEGNIVIKAIAYKQTAGDNQEGGSKASPATTEESEVLTITLTLKASEPVVPPVEGEVEFAFIKKTHETGNDTVIVVMSTKSNEETYVSKGKDSLSAVATFAKIAKNDTIVVDKAQDTAILAFVKKVTGKNDTMSYIYEKPTTPDPARPTKPAILVKEGAEVDTVIVALVAGTDIYVGKGKDSLSVASFAKIEKNDTTYVNKAQDTVVLAYAEKDGVKSDTAAYIYVTPVPVTPAPEITVNEGEEVDTVIVALVADMDIYVGKGKDSASAAASFAKIAKDDTTYVSKAQDSVVLAYAEKDGVKSVVVKYENKVSVEEDTVAVPTFNKMNDTTVVVIMPADVDSMMVSVANAAFAKFEQNDTIVLKEDAVIRAYAMKDGKYSDTVEYEFKKTTVAVEGKELAGVSVYPNPSNGQFNVAVPVNASVEVFAANGRMVKSVKVAAGVNAMQIDNAGIYFVRVRANGQVSIKKVVVR